MHCARVLCKGTIFLSTTAAFLLRMSHQPPPLTTTELATNAPCGWRTSPAHALPIIVKLTAVVQCVCCINQAFGETANGLNARVSDLRALPVIVKFTTQIYNKSKQQIQNSSNTDEKKNRRCTLLLVFAFYYLYPACDRNGKR